MTQLASDNFTRANSTGLGTNWSVVTGQGSFDIVSDTAAAHDHTVDSVEFYNAIPWSNDHYSEVTVGLVRSTDGAGVGPVTRASASANTFYRAYATGAGNIHLSRRVAGTGASIATVAGSVSTGDKLRLVVAGTSLYVYKNGALVIGPVTDTNIASGNAGMTYSSDDGLTGSLADSISFWSGGDLGNLILPLNVGGMNVQVCQ